VCRVPSAIARIRVISVVLGLMASSGSAFAAPASPQGDYTISTFAADNIAGCGTDFDASPTCYFNVDSLTNDDAFVYAGYQNTGAADGSSGSSIIAKYARSGGAPLKFSATLPGKTDGLSFNPFTRRSFISPETVPQASDATRNATRNAW